MERFTLAQAAAWTRGEAKGEAELTAVSTDSRQIPEKALFLPIKGERFDAHDFIEKAVENGAAAVVSHRRNEEYPVPALYVEDTAQALLDLAGGYRELCGGKVVGVTGSVGKTTTKELLYAVLKQKFNARKTEGNLNNEIGLPLTLFRMTRDTEVMVAEMGMNHFGEISRMTAAAQPDIAVITNIGTSHIEFLGSREGICKAKLEILEGLRPDGCAVFCGDEPLLWDKRGQLGCRVITYGMENDKCDLVAYCRGDGAFDIVNNSLPAETLPVGGKFTAKLAIPGAHNILNALAAAAVGLLLGETPEQIAVGLQSYEASGMRQNISSRTAITSMRTATTPARMRWKPRSRCSVQWRPMDAVLRCSARCLSWATTRKKATAARAVPPHSMRMRFMPTARMRMRWSRAQRKKGWSGRLRLTTSPRLSRRCGRMRKKATHCCSREAAACGWSRRSSCS